MTHGAYVACDGFVLEEPLRQHVAARIERAGLAREHGLKLVDPVAVLTQGPHADDDAVRLRVAGVANGVWVSADSKPTRQQIQREASKYASERSPRGVFPTGPQTDRRRS